MMQPAVKLRAAAKLLREEFFDPPLRQHLAVADLLESVARGAAELDWVASDVLNSAIGVADSVVEVYLNDYAPETIDIPNQENIQRFYHAHQRKHGVDGTKNGG